MHQAIYFEEKGTGVICFDPTRVQRDMAGIDVFLIAEHDVKAQFEQTARANRAVVEVKLGETMFSDYTGAEAGW